MYLNHYNLQLKPFQISTDPRFLWMGENHKEAFAVLRYGILDNRGFLLLTGDVGTGKTTLIHALVNSLGDEVVTATVPDPNLQVIDFLNYVANSFGISGHFSSKGEFISAFRTFLCDLYNRNKKTLLIIDEAQLLKHEVLEEIRLLSNIEKQNTKLLNIFFVGQNEFNDLLWEDRNRALRQRITVNYNVYALSMAETGDYIRHRLKIAGTEKKIFTGSAIREIAAFSEGFPRTINIICDHALLTGFVKGVNKIDGRIVRDCIEDLQIPRSQPREDPITFQPPDSEEINEAPTTLFFTRKTAWYKYVAAYAALFVIAFYVMGYLFEAPIIHRFNQNVSHIWSGIFESAEISETGPTDHTGIPVQIETAQDTRSREEDSPSVSKEVSDGSTRAKAEDENKKADEKNSIEVSIIEQPDTSVATPASKATVTTGHRIDQGEDDIGMSKEDKSILALLRGKVIVNFSHNSNEVSGDAVEILERIAAILTRHPDLKVGVIGYTDSSGVYSYNKSLSRFRANIVKSYLTGKGAKPEQVTAIGMGPQDPIKPNSTWQGRKTNRRVEIVLYEDNKDKMTN